MEGIENQLDIGTTTLPVVLVLQGRGTFGDDGDTLGHACDQFLFLLIVRFIVEFAVFG